MRLLGLLVGLVVGVYSASAADVVVGVIEDGVVSELNGELLGQGVDGVWVKIDGETEKVPWFEVVHVGVDQGFRAAPGYDEMHERSRVGFVRAGVGDWRGAAESVRTLAPGLLGSESRQARWVFSVLLKDAGLRGDTSDACVAMLALRMSGERKGFDPRHSLHPDAPMVGGVAGGGALFKLLRDHEAWGDVERAMIALRGAIDDRPGYGGAMEQARGAGGGIGMELCVRMCTAQLDPDSEERERARAWLRSRATSMDSTWIDGWARLALAESLALEGDEESVSRAMIELSHVVVRFGGELPIARVGIEMARRIAIEHDRGAALEALDRTYHGAMESGARSRTD